MIKDDITKVLTRNLSLDNRHSKRIVEGILKIFKDTLEAGESVMISGFGRFEVREKKERVGRNPKTKEEFPISARTVVTFISSKVFREEINDTDGV